MATGAASNAPPEEGGGYGCVWGAGGGGGRIEGTSGKPWWQTRSKEKGNYYLPMCDCQQPSTIPRIVGAKSQRLSFHSYQEQRQRQT